MPTTFRSIHHPGNTPWGIVYTRYLARPLGACTVPLMIGATTSALLGQPIWAYLVWGLPGAIALATVWAYFTMDRTIAEVALQAGQAGLRSVYDVLRERPLEWKPIFNVRTTSWQVELSAGRTTYEFRPNHWPEYQELREAALQCFQSERQMSPPSSYA